MATMAAPVLSCGFGPVMAAREAGDAPRALGIPKPNACGWRSPAVFQRVGRVEFQQAGACSSPVPLCALLPETQPTAPALLGGEAGACCAHEPGGPCLGQGGLPWEGQGVY